MDTKDAEWFKQTLDSYPASENHQQGLIEFVEELKKLNRDGRKAVVSQLRFEPMFDMVMKWNNPAYSEPLYELLAMIFEVISPSEVLSVYESYLEKFIEHVEERFQKLAYQVLTRLITENELETFLTHKEFTKKIARILGDKDLEKSSKATEFLTKLASVAPQGTDIVFKGEIGTMLKTLADDDKIRFFRIYELVGNVSTSSIEALNIIQSGGIFDDLHRSLVGPEAHVDQLSFANIVETYKQLGKSLHCYVFLSETGVISALQERVVTYCPGTMEDRIIPCVFDFFGELFMNHPAKTIIDAPDVVPTSLRLIDKMDKTQVTGAAIIMIGKVATLPEGKRYLYRQQEQLDPLLKIASDFLRNGTSDYKILSLDFTESIIFTKSTDQSSDILEMTEMWFLKISGSVKRIWDYAKEPYADTAVASIQLLAVVSTFPWGRTMILQGTPGLFEWLLDRQAACGVHSSTGGGANPKFLHAKYATVKNLHELGDSSLTEAMQQKMQTFLTEGPFYMRGEYEVALGGGEN